MNKRTKNSKTNLQAYLGSILSHNDYESLHEKLGISKKKCTLILRSPSRLDAGQILKLSEMAKIPTEKLFEFI